MEPSLRTFGRQADQLYERGVAAAKGGQRTVAAGLLRQAVRLNPQHEHAWLWLSGVLDDLEASAFCLRSALEINPHNERARQGLAQITERLEQARVPVRQTRPVSPLHEPAPAETWWSSWRDARRVWRSTLRMLWLVPSLLLLITLAIRWAIASQPLPSKAITYRDLPTVAVPLSSPVPVAVPTVATLDPAIVTGYFTEIRALQERLHAATEAYRSATAKSTTDIERAAAARTQREAIARERGTLLALIPPTGLELAHTTYLAGLQQEQQAFDDLLQFYSKYDPVLATRAGLGLQNARAQIDDGKARWDLFARQFNAQPSP